MNGRVVLVAVVCLLLLGPTLPVAAQSNPTAHLGAPVPNFPGAKAGSYDLAALTILPSELADPGYGIDTGAYSTIDGDAASINSSNGGTEADLADVRDALEQAGWQQSYYVHTGLPNPDDPTLFGVYVYIGITRFKEADGAGNGYDLIRASNVNAGFLRVRNVDQIGDASTLSRRQSTLNDGTPANSIDLLAQTGVFVAEILLTDYSGEKPDQDQMLTLGQTQVDRLTGAKASVGLSQRALLVTGDGVSTKAGYYTRVNGKQVAYFGEAPKDLKSDDTYYKGIGVTDLYYVRQTAPSTSGDDNDFLEVILDLYHFDSADDAQSAYDQYDQALTASPPTGYSDVTEIRRATSFGDESGTYSFTYDRGSGVGQVSGYRIGVLSGDLMLLLYADSGGDLPLAAVEAIADAAVTCAGKTAVCKPMKLPADLVA
jgi:hypothetical protein